MDTVINQTQQTMDIGVCQQHNRVFECYCINCYCFSMICPSCLMFDSHKGHQVCRIQQGAKDIRSKINQAAKNGLLKFQNTQNVLLDIRHAKLSLQQNLQTIHKATQTYFDQLLKTIKLRKQKFMEEIDSFFLLQIKKIQEIQNDWLQKQQICQKVLKLQSSNDDLKIMQDAQGIIHGIFISFIINAQVFKNQHNK